MGKIKVKVKSGSKKEVKPKSESKPTTEVKAEAKAEPIKPKKPQSTSRIGGLLTAKIIATVNEKK